MEKEKQKNYFIIERLELNEESNNLSNVYDLSILNNIIEKKSDKKNETKQYFRNIIKAYNKQKINLEKKIQILKVVKKAILSSNLTYKWSSITDKKIFVFTHILLLLITNIQKIWNNLGNTTSNQSINETNISFNISNSNNNSINFTNNFNNSNNITNNYNNSINTTNNESMFSFIYNNLLFDTLLKNSNIKNSLFFAVNINKMFIIPFWLFYLYKLIPKWDKINNTLFKITSYLLLCESNENNNYFYYLKKDFSILVTKKQHYYQNKELFPILPPKNEYLPDNNIFLYCVNIIIDYTFKKFITVNYEKLISNAEYIHIKILTIYIQNNLEKKIEIFKTKIIIPLLISILITIIFFKQEYEVLLYFLIFISIITSGFIYIEYIQAFKLEIDKFIDKYNKILIKKNRFIYRKNKLILFFVLKENNYTKNQIIKSIEKIINSDY